MSQNADKSKGAAVQEALEKAFSSFARRPTMSTDFAPLPESEWTEEERADGVRVVARCNPDDPTRLDVYVQWAPTPIVTIDLDFGF